MSCEAGQLLTQAREEIAQLRKVAWDCAQISGADLSGIDGPEHLVFDPSEAVTSVRELRAEHDAGLPMMACQLVELITAAAVDGDIELLKRFADAMHSSPGGS